MARKQTIHYVSDLSGKDIVDNDSPTIQFGWDGVNYTVDLTADEAEKFYSVIEKYISVATKAGKTSTPRKSSGAAAGPSAAEVRAWAQANGHEVPERGRIPAAVREAFEAAN